MEVDLGVVGIHLPAVESRTNQATVPSLWSKDFRLAFVANFFMAFAFYLLLPTLPSHLIHSMGASASMAGVIMSSYVVAGLCIRPLAGLVIDQLPRKNLYVAVFALFAACTLLYFGAVAVWLFLLLRILHGLVWGVLIPAGSTIAIDIIPAERRGEGLGYYGMSMNLAMAFSPLVGILLLDHLSFRWVLAAGSLSALLGFFFSVRIRVPAQPRPPLAPLSFNSFILTKGIPGGVALLFLTVSYGFILTFASMYGKQHGIGGTGVFFVLLSAGFLVSRAVVSPLLNRGLAVRMSIVGALLLAVTLVALGTFPVAPVYFASGLLLGLSYGCLFAALQSWMVARGGDHQRGTANSTFFTAFDLGVGAGMAAGGRIAEHSSLANGMYLCALSAAVGIAVLSRLPKR